MGIQKVRVRHEAIMDYLIANPQAKQGEVAQKFELSQSWLSIIMNSDAFKERLAEKNQEVFDETILPLRDKLLGVAHRAVEKLGDKVDDSQDAKFLLDAADKTLHRLGYAPSRGPEPATQPLLQQNNFYTVDKDDLREAREKMEHIRGTTIEGIVGDEHDKLPTPKEV